jgi:hypothetical protein
MMHTPQGAVTRAASVSSRVRSDGTTATLCDAVAICGRAGRSARAGGGAASWPPAAARAAADATAGRSRRKRRFGSAWEAMLVRRVIDDSVARLTEGDVVVG